LLYQVLPTRRTALPGPLPGSQNSQPQPQISLRKVKKVKKAKKVKKVKK